MEGPLVNSSITKKAGCNSIFSQVLGSQGYTGSDRHLSSNNTIASQDPQFIAPHMHGATLALATAGDLAE